MNCGAPAKGFSRGVVGVEVHITIIIIVLRIPKEGIQSILKHTRCGLLSTAWALKPHTQTLPQNSLNPPETRNPKP